jgi:alanyl-tRNA synthetase
MHSSDIGQRFIHYYQENGFQVLPQGSLLDPSVPMTFVGSAGLTQIESEVERGEDRAGERYVLLQTCFRHFDLEKVGKSPVHLSLFDMGGAFSFGQVSKEDILSKIWGFLLGELGLREEQIWATYFAGGEVDGYRFEPDGAVAQAWHTVGLPPSRIVGLGIDVNFWKQGGGISGKERFRKCGPTTELFFDRGPQWACGPACQPGCRCGQFVEIANVLFIHSQIDQLTSLLNPLVTPFVETVIGVERLAMLSERQSSVFEVECLAPLVRQVQSSRRATTSPTEMKSEQVIADHIRALLFLVADGAPPPGKGGRARIIRMLIRGILTHQKILGITESSFVPNLIDTALKLYHCQNPRLMRGRGHLLTYFAIESNRFERTLSVGYRQLDRLIQRGGNGTISGKQALELEKHLGFPFSLLEATLARRGIKFDRREYWEEHARWRSAVVRAG